ncbi:MAG: hypothetical protein EPO68_06830 [Planctomycetota bacterium]|nr:MAG: hypothetical protein EPO68_06830 [Planctomycetota bacterium]
MIALAICVVSVACTSTDERYWRGDLGSLGIAAPAPDAANGAASGASSDPVAAAYARAPQAQLPARVAVARLESRETEPSWRRETSPRTTSAKLVLANKADAVTSAAYQRLAALPEVADLTPLNTLVAAQTIESQEQLRAAAAAVQADLVYAYTFDSYAKTRTNLPGLYVLSLGLLGFLPLVSIEVETTASGALIDVRSGYVYGVADATETIKSSTDGWSLDEDIPRTREKAETAAFEKLNAAFEQRWKTHVAALRARP